MLKLIFATLFSANAWAFSFTYNENTTGKEMCEHFGERKWGCEPGSPAMCVRNVWLQTTRTTRSRYPRQPSERDLVEFLLKSAHTNVANPLSKTEGFYFAKKVPLLFKDYKLDPTTLPDGTIIMLRSESGCSGGANTMGLVCGKSFVQISKSTADASQVALLKTPIETALQRTGRKGEKISCVQQALVRNSWIDKDPLEKLIDAKSSDEKPASPPSVTAPGVN